MSIWDVLEKLYMDKGWTVEEGQEKTLIIRPADKTEVLDEAARAKKTASQQLSFGPVTERVLPSWSWKQSNI